MEIIIGELENFVRKDNSTTANFLLSNNIKMLQGKWAHEVMNNDGVIYLRVFFKKVCIDFNDNRDWKDYLLSDYIQFQRESKINKILR